MKKHYIFLILSSVLSFVNFSLKAQPVVELNPPIVNYGDILRDSDPFRYVTVRNIGNANLKILGANGSCGCLVPTWETDDIPPGDSSIITLRYDTHRLGAINKTITVKFNTPDNVVISVKGTVHETLGSVTTEADKTRVYPTVGSGTFFIEVEKDLWRPDAGIVVTNSLGKILTTQPMAGYSQSLTLDQPPGVYYITILNNKKTVTKKVIII